MVPIRLFDITGLIVAVVFSTATPIVELALGAPSSLGDAEEIASKIIAYRESLSSGVFELESTFKKSGSAPHRTRYSISFDGKKLRGTSVQEYQGDRFKGKSYRECYAFPGDGKALFYSDKMPPDGGVLTGSIRPDSKVSRLSAMPDPRLVGVYPVDFLLLFHARLNSLFGNQEWKAVRSEKDVINGHECAHISYVKGDEKVPDSPLTAEAWVDVARDCNVLRLVLNDSRAVVEDRIDCELSLILEVGWFPSSVRYQRHSEGIVTREEDLTIRVLQFNKGVPAETFTFASMEVPDGHDVYDYTTAPSTHYKVTDGKLVVAGDGSIVQTPHASRPSRVRTWVLVANGLVLGAIAIWFLWGKAGQRRTDAPKR